MENEKLDTWTITVALTVFAGDMSKDEVIKNADKQLADLLDGTDFVNPSVIDAIRDEI